MSKWVLFALVLMVSAYSMTAQVKLEVGARLGLVSYQGDLAPLSVRGVFTGVKPYYGLGFQLILTKNIGITVFAGRGRISADDANSQDPARVNRNLSFESTISDCALGALFQVPVQFGSDRFTFNPYVGVGVGRVSFNPQSDLNGQLIDLQPLGTEGQGLDAGSPPLYDLSSTFIYVTGGLRMSIGENWSVGFALTQHLTDTDYLDDVSTTYPDLDLLEAQRGPVARALSYRSSGDPNITPGVTGRGNSDENDAYISMTLTLARIINTGESLGSGRRKIKCPF